MKKQLALALFGCLAFQAVAQLDITAPANFQIRNQKFGDLLRPEDANSKDGTRIVLYPGQPWKCMTWQTTPATGRQYHLKNLFTSKTFAAKDQAVQQIPYAAEAKQRQAWEITKLADGLFKITDPQTGQALTATGTGGDVRMVLAPWKYQPEQKWQVNPAPEKLTM